jgi:DNA-binding NtrC family response regulator
VTQPPNAIRQTILLAEDDPAILKMVELILEEAGFGVLSAGSAHQAKLIAEGFPESIHLLLSDVMMPDVSGPQIGNSPEAAAARDARVIDVRFRRWSHAHSQSWPVLHREAVSRFCIAGTSK